MSLQVLFILVQKPKSTLHRNVLYLPKYKMTDIFNLMRDYMANPLLHFSNEEWGKMFSYSGKYHNVMLLELLLVYVYCNLCFTLYLLRFTVFDLSISVGVFMPFVISVLPWQVQLWLLLLERINQQRSCQNMRWSHTIEDPQFLIHTFTCMIQTM